MFLQGMVDPGEQVSLTLQREFSEEALNSLSSSPAERAEIHQRITNLFKSSGFMVRKVAYVFAAIFESPGGSVRSTIRLFLWGLTACDLSPSGL